MAYFHPGEDKNVLLSLSSHHKSKTALSPKTGELHSVQVGIKYLRMKNILSHKISLKKQNISTIQSMLSECIKVNWKSMAKSVSGKILNFGNEIP